MVDANEVKPTECNMEQQNSPFDEKSVVPPKRQVFMPNLVRFPVKKHPKVDKCKD